MEHVPNLTMLRNDRKNIAVVLGRDAVWAPEFKIS